MRVKTELEFKEKAAEDGEPSQDQEPTPARRALMAKVRTTGTGPELSVRSLLHRAGYRYALNRRDLPGTPDIVMPKHRLTIFVHGCFWHRHAGCPRAALPKVRRDFWDAKLRRNVARDARTVADLESLGWAVITVWSCEASRTTSLVARLAEKLDRAALERALPSTGRSAPRKARIAAKARSSNQNLRPVADESGPRGKSMRRRPQ
jgi:DNA mismatch endonuclease (patch repair protein)